MPACDVTMDRRHPGVENSRVSGTDIFSLVWLAEKIAITKYGCNFMRVIPLFLDLDRPGGKHLSRCVLHIDDIYFIFTLLLLFSFLILFPRQKRCDPTGPVTRSQNGKPNPMVPSAAHLQLRLCDKKQSLQRGLPAVSPCQIRPEGLKGYRRSSFFFFLLFILILDFGFLERT